MPQIAGFLFEMNPGGQHQPTTIPEGARHHEPALSQQCHVSGEGLFVGFSSAMAETGFLDAPLTYGILWVAWKLSTQVPLVKLTVFHRN